MQVTAGDTGKMSGTGGAVALAHRRELIDRANKGERHAAFELLRLYIQQPHRDDAAGAAVRDYIAERLAAVLDGADSDRALNLRQPRRGTPTKDATREHGDLLRFMASRIAGGDSQRAAALAAADALPYSARHAERLFRNSGALGPALVELHRRERTRIAESCAPWFDGSAFPLATRIPELLS